MPPSQPDGRTTREVTAADFAFALARLADPAVNSPVISSFAQVQGFADFAKRLADLRRPMPAFAALPAHEQYARAGGIDGVIVRGERELEIVLAGPNAQILYWFAMPFTTPMAWEAVAYYDGKGGREHFADHAVGTGPYRLALYEKQYRFMLERNPTLVRQPARRRRCARRHLPAQIDPEDIAQGRIDAAYAGRRLPFIDRVNFSRERESIPRFNKFLQGYYDDGGIIKESFDAVVTGRSAFAGHAARGMRLDKTVEPSIRYIGFNMDDSVVGAPAGERGRKLRQAMSLAIDVEPVSASCSSTAAACRRRRRLPPGIFGYDAGYKNPFRQYDLARARKLLAEAGYENGIDPATGNRLKLSFDTSATTPRRPPAVRVPRRFLAPTRARRRDQRHHLQPVSGQGPPWAPIRSSSGAGSPISRIRKTSCSCSSASNARSKSGGPNTANFCDARFDRLYQHMKNLPNDERRAGADRADAGDPRAGAALDRALSR